MDRRVKMKQIFSRVNNFSSLESVEGDRVQREADETGNGQKHEE